MTPTTAVPVAAAPFVPAAAPRLSVAEFLIRYANAPNAELVDGIVLEKPMSSFRHGKICLLVGRLIGNHVEAHDLGHVTSNDTRMQTGSASVRGGDVLYFSYERMPKDEAPEGLPSVAADLAVEVKSPTDTWIDVFTKVVEYLEAGVRVVVDPGKSTVSVYRADDQDVLRIGDVLTLPAVLPGFSVPERGKSG